MLKITKEEFEKHLTDFFVKYSREEDMKDDIKNGKRLKPSTFINYALQYNKSIPKRLRDDLNEIEHDEENMDSIGDIATVTVHIKKIREKIEFDTANPQYIETIWGVGYRFKVQRATEKGQRATEKGQRATEKVQGATEKVQGATEKLKNRIINTALRL